MEVSFLVSFVVGVEVLRCLLGRFGVYMFGVVKFFLIIFFGSLL